MLIFEAIPLNAAYIADTTFGVNVYEGDERCVLSSTDSYALLFLSWGKTTFERHCKVVSYQGKHATFNSYTD